jgi:hypothetical protein
MVQASDHISPLLGASPTVTLSKNGGGFAAPAGAVAEIGNGWYRVAGNATDTGTMGPLLLHATAAGGDPTDDRYEVVAVNPQSATAFLSGIAGLAPPTRWNVMLISTGGAVTAGGSSEIPSAAAITSSVLDTACKPSTHDQIRSLGLLIRLLLVNPNSVISPELVSSNQTGCGTNQVRLGASASSTVNDPNLVGQVLSFTAGTGSDTVRTILSYTGLTDQVATVDGNWGAQPDATTTYEVYRAPRAVVADYVVGEDPLSELTGGTNLLTVNSDHTVNVSASSLGITTSGGVAQANVVQVNGAAVGPDLLVRYQGTVVAATATTVTLDAGASTVNGAYNGGILQFESGVSAGMVGTPIVSYVGSSRILTVNKAFHATPAPGDAVTILGSFYDLLGTVPGTNYGTGTIGQEIAQSNSILTTGNITAQVNTYAAGQDPASLVWGAAAGTFNAVNSMGAKVNLLVTLDVIDLVSGATGSNTPSQFVGSSALSAVDNFYVGSYLAFTGGALRGLARQVGAYTGASKTFTLVNPLPAAPALSDPFVILGGVK